MQSYELFTIYLYYLSQKHTKQLLNCIYISKKMPGLASEHLFLHHLPLRETGEGQLLNVNLLAVNDVETLLEALDLLTSYVVDSLSNLLSLNF